jgi:hypothetical protein
MCLFKKKRPKVRYPTKDDVQKAKAQWSSHRDIRQRDVGFGRVHVPNILQRL